MSNSANLTKKPLSTSRVCTLSIPKPKQEVTIVSTSKTSSSQILVLTPEQIEKLGLTQHINKAMDSQAKLKETTIQAQPARKKSMRVSKITIINPQSREADKKVETAASASTAKPIISEMKNKLTNILMNASAKKESENLSFENTFSEDGRKRKQSEERQMPSKIIKVTDDNDVVILDRATLHQQDYEENEDPSPNLLFADDDYNEYKECEVELGEELACKQKEPRSPEDSKQKINVLSNEQISLPYTYIELLKSHTSQSRDKNATSTPLRIYSTNSKNSQSTDFSPIEPLNPKKDVGENGDHSSDGEDINTDVDCRTDEMRVLINDFNSCDLIQVSEDGTCRNLNVNRDKPQQAKAGTSEPILTTRVIDLTSNKEPTTKKVDEATKETDTSPKIILNSHISKLIKCNMMNILKATTSGSNSASKNSAPYKIIKPSEVINISDHQGQPRKILDTVQKGARAIMVRLDRMPAKKFLKIPGSGSVQQSRIVSSNIRGTLSKQSNSILHSGKLEPSTSTDSQELTAELSPNHQETGKTPKPAPKKRGRKKKSEMIERELMLQRNAEPEPEPEIELSKRGRKRKVVDYSALAEGDFETEEYEQNSKTVEDDGDNFVEIDTMFSCNSHDTINCEYNVQESSTPSDGTVKRKRGRPRKIRIEDITEDNEGSEENEAKLDSNDETHISDCNKTSELSTEVPKRKRGRPRKNKIENVETDNSDAVTINMDEKILQNKDNVQDTETPDKEVTVNTAQKSDTPKRKRGRPRKNPIDISVPTQISTANSTEETILEETAEKNTTETETETDLNYKNESSALMELATDVISPADEISASDADQLREEVRVASINEVSLIDAKKVSATCSTDQMKTSVVTSASLKQTPVVDSVEVNSSSDSEKTLEINMCDSGKIKQTTLVCVDKIVTDSEETRQEINLDITKNNCENKDTDSKSNEVGMQEINVSNSTGESNSLVDGTEVMTENFSDPCVPNDSSAISIDQKTTENGVISIGMLRNSIRCALNSKQLKDVSMNVKNYSRIMSTAVTVKSYNCGESTEVSEKVSGEQLEVNITAKGTPKESTADVNLYMTKNKPGDDNSTDEMILENLEYKDNSNDCEYIHEENSTVGEHGINNISEVTKKKKTPDTSYNQINIDHLGKDVDEENSHIVSEMEEESVEVEISEFVDNSTFKNESDTNDETASDTKLVKDSLGNLWKIDEVCPSKKIKSNNLTTVEDKSEINLDPVIQQGLTINSVNTDNSLLSSQKDNSQETDDFFQGLASQPPVKKKIANFTTPDKISRKKSEHIPTQTVNGVTPSKHLINTIFGYINPSQQSKKLNGDSASKLTNKDATLAMESTEINATNLSIASKNESQKSPDVVKTMQVKKQKLDNLVEDQSVDISNSNENVICAVCKEQVSKSNWSNHKLRYHNNLAWKEGGKPLDLNNQELVMSTLRDIYKKKKPLHCEKCGTAKKSVMGYLSHKSMCQKSLEEVSAMKVECQFCDRSVLPVSMSAHLKYCKGVETQKDDDTKVEITEVKIESLPLEGKRKAAARAESLIMSLKEEGSIETDILDAIKTRKVWCKNFDFRPTRFMKKHFCKEMSKHGTLKCLFHECTFQATELNLFINHLYQCSRKPGEVLTGFTCKLCVLTFNTEEKICQHVLQSHADSIKVEESSDDNTEEFNDIYDEDSDEDEDHHIYRTTYANKPNLLHGIRFLLKHRICPPTTNIVYPPAAEWTQKFCDQNFAIPDLFSNWRTVLRSWVKLDPILISSYLPSLRYSACVSVVASKKFVDPFKLDHKWKRYMLFEAALSENGISTFFCGGPVFALAWVPTPHDQVGYEQILAVSTSSSTDKGYMLHEKYSESGLIQFWNCGPLLNNVPVTEAPKLEFCIAHDYGPIWCMEWCPSGCYDKQPMKEYEFFQRLGILAVGSANTNIYLYSVCFPMMNSGKILKPQPVLKMVLDSVIDQGTNDLESHVTKISWSKASGHRFLVAGYANGMVAIFDLCTTSALLKLGLDEEGIETIMPYRVFSAHNHAITALSLFHLNNGRRWIMTGSIDRSIKYWDLENLSVPISHFPKVIITDGVWLSHWLSSIQTVDDSCAYGLTPMLAHQPRNFESESTSIMHSNSRITSVTGSEWTNGFVDGSVMGEIKAFFPHQMFFSLDGDKTFSKKKAVLGYARLLEKALPIAERVQEENRRLQSLNIKMKQHIANKAKMNIEQIMLSSSKPEPTNYWQAEEKYGLVFCDMILDSIDEFSINNSCFVANNYSKLHPTRANIYPMQSVNKVSLNPNQGSFSYLAAGYQAGFVRVSCLHFVNHK